MGPRICPAVLTGSDCTDFVDCLLFSGFYLWCFNHGCYFLRHSAVTHSHIVHEFKNYSCFHQKHIHLIIISILYGFINPSVNDVDPSWILNPWRTKKKIALCRSKQLPLKVDWTCRVDGEEQQTACGTRQLCFYFGRLSSTSETEHVVEATKPNTSLLTAALKKCFYCHLSPQDNKPETNQCLEVPSTVHDSAWWVELQQPSSKDAVTLSPLPSSPTPSPHPWAQIHYKLWPGY